MTERHYLRPVADLRESLDLLLGFVEAEDEKVRAAVDTVTGAIDELADFRGLLSQHIDVGNHRVYVKLGPLGRLGFEVAPLR